eukprot:scaffold14064_cov177-Amphora_coffeaeformis.AAC.5
MNTLRIYQRRIVDAIGETNAIVKMPTGSGKTVVAAQLVASHLQQRNSCSLFFVPTQDLVEQQALVIERWCPAACVLRFTGGMTDPQIVDASTSCLVATPKAFLHLQQRKPAFSWETFGLAVFDEVHHVLKDHPYRHIAFRIKAFLESNPTSHKIQIIGMSASLTYAVRDTAIISTLNRICRELRIEHMISPSNEELIEGGYVSQHGRNVEIERAGDPPEGLIPKLARKPHEMYRQFMDRVTTSRGTEFAQAYWKVVLELEKISKDEHPNFESPLCKGKLSSWEEYAYRMAPPHTNSVLRVLQHWYVGLRLLVQTWEEEQHLVLLWLNMNDAFDVSLHESQDEFEYLKHQAQNATNFLKVDRLRFHLKEKRDIKGDTFRCIIFAQQRITTFILSHFINTDTELQEIGLKAEFVTARNTCIAPGISVGRSAANASIERFRSGTANVIVATSVLEEGFDVPAANVVISYDPLKDSVELCQRSGRARHEESNIVILDERPDRPLERLEAVRALQDTMVQRYNPNMDSSLSSNFQEENKQKSREQTANRTVLQNISKRTTSPVAAINEYVKKTKAIFQETCSRGTPFVYTMSYSTILRSIPAIKCQASSKKEAKKKCAVRMLAALDAEMHRQV